MVVLLELSVVVVIDVVDVVDIGLVVVERSCNLSMTVKFSSGDKSVSVSKVVVIEDFVVVVVVVDDEKESSSYNSLLKLTKFLC